MINGREKLHIDFDGSRVGNVSIFEIAQWAVQNQLAPVSVTPINSTTGVTLTAAQLTSAQNITLIRNAGPAAAFTDTTDTAANIAKAIPALAKAPGGFAYPIRIRIVNNTTQTQTIAGGTGVTVSGTATLATLTYRDFILQQTSATAFTLTDVGSGTN